MGARHRLRLAGLRRQPARDPQGRHPHRQRRPALLQPHDRHAHRQAAEGRQRRHHPQRRGAEGRLRRARRQARAPSPPIDPQTGAILALASTPSYDPSSFAGQRRQGHGGLVEAPEEEQRGRADAQPGAARRPTRPAPPSRSSRRPRRWRTASHDIDEATDTPGPVHPAGHQHRRWRTRATSPARTPPCARPCGSPATPSSRKIERRPRQRARCSRQAEKFGFNDKELDTPVRAGRERLPRGQQAAERHGGHRPVRATAPPRCRWPWSPPPIANDGKLMKPYMVDQLVAPEPQRRRAARSRRR